MRNVVGSVRSLIVLSLVLGLALPAQAMLQDRGSFSYTDGLGNTGMVNLIYDQDLDITWVGDANLAKTSGFDADGLLPWQQAVNWAAGLTIGGMNNWRLPTTTQPDATCSVQQIGGVSIGDGCRGSEMGRLYHPVARAPHGIMPVLISKKKYNIRFFFRHSLALLSVVLKIKVFSKGNKI